MVLLEHYPSRWLYPTLKWKSLLAFSILLNIEMWTSHGLVSNNPVISSNPTKGLWVPESQLGQKRSQNKFVGYKPIWETSHSRTQLHSTYLKSSLTASSVLTAGSAATRGIGSHFLVRILFLRGLGVVYLTAFLVALHQNKALIGYKGITPAHFILEDAEKRGEYKMKQREERQQKRKFESFHSTYSGSNWWTVLKNTKFFSELAQSNYLQPLMRWWLKQDRMSRPLITLLWLLPSKLRKTVHLNRALDLIAALGIILSCSLILRGAANVPILVCLWLCQRSLMSVGGPWYGFGWEPQLAELTFHAWFLVPILSLNRIPPNTPVPKVAVWSMRWFLFRIMMGAGLIKLRSKDQKWKMKNLTAMDYFYETQPVPNPFSRMLHSTPKMWHKFEVLTNHVVELIAPWFLLVGSFVGRDWTIGAGVLQIIFQSVLICSGNLSFLNWLTMLPAVFCFDDAFISRLFHPEQAASASVASYTHLITTGAGVDLGRMIRKFTNFFFASLILKLSVPVIKNLCSSKQLMNASFDPLRLVNTYGAFGVVNEERIELVVESAQHYDGPWKEYEFKVKPSNVYNKPRWISPYHYRLDWQMWIASSCGSIERSPWMYTFLYKLLAQDSGVLDLIAKDPFSTEEVSKVGCHGNEELNENDSPRYIRVEKYLYKFNTNKGKGQPYWIRERVGKYFPLQGIASMKTLKDYCQLN